MSVESMAIALHHSRTTNPTTKWVLAGIANHDGDGGSWPTIATLAMYALCSERTAQRAVAELVALGEVSVKAQAGGTREWRSDRRPNLYEFLLKCPPNCDRSKNHRVHEVAAPEELSTGTHGVSPVSPRKSNGVTPVVARGDTGDANGVTPPVERGDTAMSPKPSLEPSIEGGGEAGPSGGPERVGRLPLRGHHLPKDWRPTNADMHRMRVERPDVDLELELVKFRDHYHFESGSKAIKTDWCGPWRNWIRNTHRTRTNAQSTQATQPGYHQTDEQIRADRLARAGDITPPAHLADNPAAEREWLRAARERIANGLPIDDTGTSAA